MARDPQKAARAMIDLPSTAVEVVLLQGQFQREDGVPDQDFMTVAGNVRERECLSSSPQTV